MAIELNIDVDSYKNTLESMTTSELSDYLKSLSSTVKDQTIKQNRALFLIGQKSVSQKWYNDNMSNTEHDSALLAFDTFDKYDQRTREFVASVTNVSYVMQSDEIAFSDVLKAKGYLFDGDISKVTDVQELQGIINKGNVQIDSIMSGSDILKPLVNAHKAHIRDMRIEALKLRLTACKNSSVELAKLRLKQTIAKGISDTNKVNSDNGVSDRIANYRTMYAKTHTEVSKSDKVECVTTVSDDDTHSKIVNGEELHKHKGIVGYHSVTRKHKRLSPIF